MSNDTIIILICIFAFAILICFAFYNGLIIRKYNISTKKKIGEQGINIVLISDLHCSIYGKNQKKLIEKIKGQNPDLILIAGDIVDQKRLSYGAELFLAGIKDIAPVFYALGNHEYKQGNVEKTKTMIRDFGITILDACYIRTNIKGMPVLIAGIDDPIKVRYVNRYLERNSMRRAFSSLGDIEDYKILIAHRPEKIDKYLKYDFDLIVSGHTHGGQVRIPFILNGLFSPGQGWFPKYAGGLFYHGKLTHIISRGVSFMPLLPRVFNPPEVVCIIIEKDNELLNFDK
jgi:predicted MPP superfamily phosphohydrolase